MGTEGAELSPPGTVICPSGQSRAGEAGTSPQKPQAAVGWEQDQSSRSPWAQGHGTQCYPRS